MKKEFVIAVVGATGVVGKEIIEILESRKFPISKLVLLASERSAGTQVLFNKKPVSVEILSETSFEGVDIALFSAGASVSAKFVPIAAAQGVYCIDNTSHFRMDPKVPLVVPEVNPEQLRNKPKIIANPNCSTAQLVVVLKPIYDAVGIRRVDVATYQSVSGAGKEAIDELEKQSRMNLSGNEYQPKKFTQPIAFNLIPHIDSFVDNGYTKEEMKVINETRKILGDEGIAIHATAVRVPVFVCHSEVVTLQTKQFISAADVRALLEKAPGVTVVDNPKKAVYPTPRSVSGTDDVAVGRIRTDISQENGLSFWCVGDNLRKGAALNAVQIAEHLAVII